MVSPYPLSLLSPIPLPILLSLLLRLLYSRLKSILRVRRVLGNLEKTPKKYPKTNLHRKCIRLLASNGGPAVGGRGRRSGSGQASPWRHVAGRRTAFSPGPAISVGSLLQGAWNGHRLPRLLESVAADSQRDRQRRARHISRLSGLPYHFGSVISQESERSMRILFPVMRRLFATAWCVWIQRQDSDDDFAALCIPSRERELQLEFRSL